MSRYPSYFTYGPFGFPRWTPAVRILIIATAIVFMLQLIDRISGQPAFTLKFGLTPAQVTGSFHVWQLVTYMFLHAPGQLFHILFNMLALWMFGSQLESTWGTRQFTKFYFVCGVGAGLILVLLSPGSVIPTIGASGAIYGVLLAFAVLFPDQIIYWIIFPIKAKWFVLILGVMAFFSSMSGAGSGVAHVAHLGGMLCGYLYLKGGGIFSDIRHGYERWRRARLRRKFDVYYNDRQRREDDERWRRWKG